MQFSRNSDIPSSATRFPIAAIAAIAAIAEKIMTYT
jgi:carbamoylphosphate synthase large subunit